MKKQALVAGTAAEALEDEDGEQEQSEEDSQPGPEAGATLTFLDI